MEIRFAAGMRVGLETPITRRWARRGTRPSAPGDQRIASAWLVGGICPKLGKGAALVLPGCNIAAMNLHLQEIAAAVAPGARAVRRLDRAGWHMSAKRAVPRKATLLPLPRKAPGLTPVETLWPLIRQTGLQNRIFPSHGAIVDHA